MPSNMATHRSRGPKAKGINGLTSTTACRGKPSIIEETAARCNRTKRTGLRAKLVGWEHAARASAVPFILGGLEKRSLRGQSPCPGSSERGNWKGMSTEARDFRVSPELVQRVRRTLQNVPGDQRGAAVEHWA